MKLSDFVFKFLEDKNVDSRQNELAHQHHRLPPVPFGVVPLVKVPKLLAKVGLVEPVAPAVQNDEERHRDAKAIEQSEEEAEIKEFLIRQAVGSAKISS